jgi:hypothetical protein
MHDPTTEWNEHQAQFVEMHANCCRDNPESAIGSRPRDILLIMQEASDRRRYPDWWEICKRAADEIRSSRYLHQDRANSELQTMELVRDLILMIERQSHTHSNYGCAHCEMIARANRYLAAASHRRVRSFEHAAKIDQEQKP